MTHSASLFPRLLGLGLAMAAAAACADETNADPIFVRPASTVKSMSVIANAKYFEHVKLEEADRFDGYGIDFEVAVPLNPTMQLRFVLPAYTRGKARLLSPATYQRIDIKGTGGTFDYPGIVFDNQIRQETEVGYNAAWFVGFGMVLKPWGVLDTTHGDKYNHQGKLLHLGVKADGALSEGNGRWLANAGLRRYACDDLNPAETGDNFTHWELMGALLFNHRSDRYIPAVELAYTGDLHRYNALHVVPELILPFDKRLDLKIGIPVSLTGDGERWGLRLQLSY
jgi:hypothetical protein